MAQFTLTGTKYKQDLIMALLCTHKALLTDCTVEYHQSHISDSSNPAHGLAAVTLAASSQARVIFGLVHLRQVSCECRYRSLLAAHLVALLSAEICPASWAGRSNHCRRSGSSARRQIQIRSLPTSFCEDCDPRWAMPAASELY